MTETTATWTRMWFGFLSVAALAGLGCVTGREIFHPRGCEQRLGIPYKRAECFACVTRPRPHVFLPDQPDGMRCVPR